MQRFLAKRHITVRFVTTCSPSPAQLCSSLARPRHAVCVIAAQAVRSVTQTEGPVQVLVRDHAAASQGAAPAHRLNLQLVILKTDGVIAVHRALELQREDTLQIAGGTGDKGAPPLRCCDLKAAIELGEIAFAEKAIRFFQRGASGQPQLLRQPPLPGAEVALRAPARLRE
jgi:hypothetical protein